MLRWINRIVGILLLLIVIAVASLFLLPADRIAKVAADQIRTATGRNVDISGDVSMTLWPVLGVSADGLEVGNADWAEKGPMLQASDASIGIDLAALLTGEIRITNIEATSPTIRLQSLADGRANWQFTDSEGAASIETTTEPDQAPGAFSIQKLSVKDATLIYDAEGSDLVSYAGVDLALDWPERLGPADINAVLRPSGVPVSLVARIEQFASFLAGDVQGVTVWWRKLGQDCRACKSRGRSGRQTDA
jgi:AsmA protein